MKSQEDLIRELAYEIYLYRMENNQKYAMDSWGNLRELNSTDDWLLAEKELNLGTPERLLR